jgi:hypothetical protein
MTKTIYLGWRRLPYDVHEQDVAHKAAQPDSQVPAASAPFHLRRANPATALLPVTRRWILLLPPEARPRLLAAQFARIANQLCLLCRNPDAALSYINELLQDRRGDRKGFPVGVLRELQALRRHYEKHVVEIPTVDGWADAR